MLEVTDDVPTKALFAEAIARSSAPDHFRRLMEDDVQLKA